MSKAQLQEREREKRNKIIEKAKAKNHDRLQERIQQEDARYESFFQANLEKLRKRWDRKKQIRINKIKTQYQNKTTDKVKKTRGQEVKKRIPITIKQLALREVCLYSKLARSDRNGYVLQVDTGMVVKRSECQGGHAWPQHNFPHMAFLLDNIRPISPNGNRQQLDTIANWIDKTPLPIERKNLLAQNAVDKELKNQLRDNKYYQGMYDMFKALNKIEKKRLDCHGEKAI
jgi:hypothetical protein